MAVAWRDMKGNRHVDHIKACLMYICRCSGIWRSFVSFERARSNWRYSTTFERSNEQPQCSTYGRRGCAFRCVRRSHLAIGPPVRTVSNGKGHRRRRATVEHNNARETSDAFENSRHNDGLRAKRAEWTTHA